MISLLSGYDVAFFDLDGTLYDTNTMAIYSFRQAERDLADRHGLDLPTWTDAEILATVGHPGVEQGEMLLPPSLHHLADELHRYVQSYERTFIKENRAVLFDGVEDLLQQLNEQEFRVYLASNCSTGYRDLVLGHFDLFRYFDHPFCIGEFPGHDKAGMVRQALAKVGAKGGFMIGDRTADMVAGRANGLTTVACRYGFGGDEELALADLAVDSVAELQALLARRNLVLRDAATLLRKRWESTDTTHLLAGVSGRDNTGKTSFALELAQRLRADGVSTLVVHVDDFHRPRAQRRSDTLSPPQAYYQLTFDWQRLVDEVFLPVSNGATAITWQRFDRLRDKFADAGHHRFDGPTVVIVEGVFLLRPELADHFDYRILLECDEDELLRRAEQRDQGEFGCPEEVRRRYLARYLPGQQLYEQEARPRETADLVIDNTAVDFPRILSYR